jgi:hypothetical protein
VYAAKFKIGTVATIFKMAGNSLSKPIGMRAISVVGKGSAEKDTPQGTKKVLTGILFDRYHKIPKPKGNKIKHDWKTEYIKAFEKGKDLDKFLEVIWNLRK